jgi:Ni,Fe-hydrogenase I small subunit
MAHAYFTDHDMDHTPRKIMRPGKTNKDHKSGAHAQRLVNQQIRADYYKDGCKGPWPYYTCNGKRNRQTSSPVVKE